MKLPFHEEGLLIQHNPAGMGRAKHLLTLTLLVCALSAAAQQQPEPLPTPVPATTQLPEAPTTASITGTVTDTDGAFIPGADIKLEDLATGAPRDTITDTTGTFTFSSVAAGKYIVRIKAHGFSSWKVENILITGTENLTLTPVELGVEAIDSSVSAITVEDLAERQITAEEHQRILGILPNFYVSYLGSGAMPLTRRQKFKLAVTVSVDPLTFFTTGVNAGIEQAQNSFAGYGHGFSGYAERYSATYGDRLSATFIGSAILPSILHQDPRYFYNGHDSIVHRALYAISTVVICKGDNGHWQPNYSNVFGNLAAGGISTLYYPNSARHDLQTSVDNILIGISEGAFGTLFQEFLLRHVTHGVPTKP